MRWADLMDTAAPLPLCLSTALWQWHSRGALPGEDSTLDMYVTPGICLPWKCQWASPNPYVWGRIHSNAQCLLTVKLSSVCSWCEAEKKHPVLMCKEFSSCWWLLAESPASCFLFVYGLFWWSPMPHDITPCKKKQKHNSAAVTVN